jgi:hypothetical protein
VPISFLSADSPAETPTAEEAPIKASPSYFRYFLQGMRGISATAMVVFGLYSLFIKKGCSQSIKMIHLLKPEKKYLQNKQHFVIFYKI